MTTTYDPHAPEVPRRGRRPRRADPGLRPVPRLPAVLQVLQRRSRRCSSSSTATTTRTPARLTTAEQDQVVDECFQCKLCYVNCPYIPGPARVGARLPAPHAASRRRCATPPSEVTASAAAHQQRDGPHRPASARSAQRIGTGWPTPSSASAAVLVRKRDGRRPPASRASASCRRSPASASPRGSRSGRGCASSSRQGEVAVFPTCLVEYQAPAIGQDLVKVYERNGIECDVADGPAAAAPRCCTAATSSTSTKVAAENVKVLAAAVRDGHRHRRAPADVRLRAEEGLRRLRRRPRRRAGRRAHLRRRRVPHEGAQGRGHEPRHRLHRATCPRPSPTTRRATCGPRTSVCKSRDLMKLTGARIKLVQQCSGIDGMWGLRAENAELSARRQPEAGRRDRAGRRRGRRRRLPPRQHGHHRADRARCRCTPSRSIARAYGIPAEEERP